ncbi:hypothetical protein BGW36DRAFT_104179 [Talaromyces proteolyticus]|uniref:Copper acquisition factor BIM1-like domain-containing protein n=1 Tax=Talaromyces proteolyticus TaxID=1131652 RepID=A0AAD4Q0Z6_9EURO|nr:uncharacterized protein BGW36DRAFT_104179 [Talaromyces proteolyticus]KAH8701734.1 hypothetical protein BGW36DRAFT_104179 [Talaromyces proteolyticus]
MHTERSTPSIWTALAVLSLFLLQAINAHTIIVYPGYRGNNLQTNGTVAEANGLGQAVVNDTSIFPYGMMWMYPCGGMPTSTNRTKWPVQGGAISVQPGWFQGHATAFFYFNLGLGATPPNMSHPMLPPFQIIGPSANPYPGTFCLPQVPLPANITVNVGDLATIQVVETAKHGAALYNCVDIEFAEPKDCVQVTPDNCFNSSDIQFANVYTANLTSAASITSTTLLSFTPLVAMSLWELLM